MSFTRRYPRPYRDRPKTAERMNKTESAYADALSLQGISWKFEAMKLRLADNTFYTPDFMIVGDHIELHEVKGFWEDDARVKIKVAAEQYPCFKFVAVQFKKKAWTVEEF